MRLETGMEGKLPKTYRCMMVTEQCWDYRRAVSIVEKEIPETLRDTQILVRNRFVGVNASDIPFVVGRYDPSVKPPYPCGFDGLGEIVMKGSKVKLELHQPVAYITAGAFAEFCILEESKAMPVPALNKEFISLLVCGLTAMISFDVVLDLKPGEKVLVTAAAGGTGQFAVQLAKAAGCHVIGTCGSQAKVDTLASLGCDRVINYNTENLANVLKNEYPNGVDVIYESVGGEMFDTCVESIALHGRIVVIGWISTYQSELGYEPPKSLPYLLQTLLSKSASVHGFKLPDHADKKTEAFKKLLSMVDSGQVKCLIDTGKFSEKGGPLLGLEGVYDAVEYLYSKKSVGKIIVELL